MSCSGSGLLGGYVAGRLCTKWVNLHTDEVFSRDTAHGFLAWALVILLVAGLLSSTISAMIGTGVQAAANVAGGAAMGGAAAAASDDANPTAYFVDTLLRPADPARPVEGGGQASAEVTRILRPPPRPPRWQPTIASTSRSLSQRAPA